MAEYLKHQAFTYTHPVRQKEIVTQCVVSNPYDTSVDPYLIKKARGHCTPASTAQPQQSSCFAGRPPVRNCSPCS